MCPIVVGSVHNFGRSDGDIIYLGLAALFGIIVIWNKIQASPPTVHEFLWLVPLSIFPACHACFQVFAFVYVLSSSFGHSGFI